ncbi:unnamed protein product [Callosobruchus maculatus]|uniref:Uncharacterized protein n=1 Tax=Callosobruchus maculatus TaxID=64391 RepID=A0A653CKC5_CALMS|nr:unnamed protein product [Callosobruchus maculatus]
MSHIVLRIVLAVCLVYGVVCTDIDLQTCIDNFNVHRDKIIRTQDSQNMGAKYLNEIDLGSREECLRLCCETDNCDVFVFEEKNSGSCYLFHCGPPEDFKCKFTHHVNYSSAVLSINRHLPDLESQIKLTKHEQDLTNLRRVEPETDGLKPAVIDVKHPFTSSTTTVVPKEILPLRKNKEEEAPAPVSDPSSLTASASGRCSRFQFECRGGNGECIAIYNACDGVPQCADGSDEAPELGCPDLMAANAPPVNTQAPPTRAETQVQRAGLKQIHPIYDGGVPDMIQPAPQVVMPHQDTVPPYQPAAPVPYQNHFPQVPQDFLRPEPKQGYRAPYEPPPYVAGQTLQQQWMPHQPNQMLPQQQPMQVQYPVGKNSRMFSHKENNIQMQEAHELGILNEAYL